MQKRRTLQVLNATLTVHGRTANGLGTTTGRPTMEAARRRRSTNIVPNVDDQRQAIWLEPMLWLHPRKGHATHSFDL